MVSGVDENVQKWTPVSHPVSFFSGLNSLGVDGRCTPTCVAPCDVPGCNGLRRPTLPPKLRFFLLLTGIRAKKMDLASPYVVYV